MCSPYPVAGRTHLNELPIWRLDDSGVIAPLRPCADFFTNLLPTWAMSGPRPGEGMCNLMKDGVFDLTSGIQLREVLAQADRVIVIPAVSEPTLCTIELERPSFIDEIVFFIRSRTRLSASQRFIRTRSCSVSEIS